tara:strand:- start:1015 stop:1470 length:456 start_codon:yes stop_codon:yes gene_type:complete
MRAPIVLVGLLVLGCSGGGYLDDLQHASAEKRLAAASFLGAQRDPQAVPGLIGLLEDPDARVRAKGAWALGMIRARSGVIPLLARVGDPDRTVKQAAIGALMNIEEPAALPGLKKALATETDAWVVGDLEKAITYLTQFEGESDIGESTFR